MLLRLWLDLRRLRAKPTRQNADGVGISPEVRLRQASRLSVDDAINDPSENILGDERTLASLGIKSSLTIGRAALWQRMNDEREWL